MKMSIASYILYNLAMPPVVFISLPVSDSPTGAWHSKAAWQLPLWAPSQQLAGAEESTQAAATGSGLLCL